ncbi:ATPase, T2SS/T4P/T4SS family [Candidatus Omnitrophota bacterium]
MIRKYDKILYETLIAKQSAPREILEPLLKEINVSDKTLAALLIEKNLFSEEDILKMYSEKLGLSLYKLKKCPIDKTVIKKIPARIASYYKFMPLKIEGRLLTIVAASPLDIKMQDEIRTQLGYDIEVGLASLKEVLDALKDCYGIGTETMRDIELKEDSDPEVKKETYSTASHEVEDIEKLAEDASVIKLVNQIILEGWKKRATDIHIEPYRDNVLVRYRIDGVLYEANVSSSIKRFLSAIISRIKIMSNLNIVERRLPQDGRAVVKVQKEVLDLRISTIPTPFGESVVIRLLPSKMLFSLEKLGLHEEQLHIFERLIKKPHGIIFVTGPTGSGKTTTLYTCLSKINTKERKIITIEDPIEYEITGVTQMQVMSEIGLDFAKGLRSVLRHDPDVIMVGEVRDLETAEISIRVALTGHLIFSTLHTNDAASAVTRLIDIGVEPYLIASSVEAFIAQRLIRNICQKCKYEDKSLPQELKDLIAKEAGLESSKKLKVYRGKGCDYCNFTGFFGRAAIYEILLLDDKLKELVIKKSSSSEIRKLAIAQGMQVLRQDGWQKVLAGSTTPEEVMQVAPLEEDILSNKKNKINASSGSSKELDRRVYARIDKKVNLRYKVYDSNEELLKKKSSPEQFSVVKNISAGGLLFVSNVPIPITAVIDLKVELPDYDEPIECLAKVVRIAKTEKENIYNIAVCFLDIASVQRARLNKYVEEHESENKER